MTRAGWKVRVDSQKYEGSQKKTATEAKLWNVNGGGNVEEIKGFFESG